MALPMNAAPKYKLVLPSTKESYFFKPFLVKQEKALLLAMQSEDASVMVRTLSEVIDECFDGKIDTANIAMFDLEYIFSQIRAKSVGEIVTLTIRCEKCDEENEKAKVNINLNIADIEVEFPEGQTTDIPLWEGVGVIMKYPSVKVMEQMEKIKDPNDPDAMYAIISACMDMIYTEDETFPIEKATDKEVKDFLDNLTNEQFKRIQAFFENMPKLSKTINYSCPECGHAHEKKIEGLNSFFS